MPKIDNLIETPNLKFELAAQSDAEEILAVEREAFGKAIHPEEMRQILEDEIGLVYIARNDEGKIVGYQTVLFRNPDEAKLQPYLDTPGFMHDDIHPIEEGKEAYLHLLGVKKEYQGQGIAKKLLQFAIDNLSPKFEKITTIIRLNNLESLSPVMSVTGVHIDSFQERNIDPAFHGSKETNVNLVKYTNQLNKPELHLSSAYIWEESGEPNENIKDILVPVTHGQESDLNSEEGQELKHRVEILLSRGFKGIKLVKGIDIGREGKTYLYFQIS